jgi:hypothetical protein
MYDQPNIQLSAQNLTPSQSLNLAEILRQIENIQDWIKIFNGECMLKILPLVGTTALFVFVTLYFKHFLALPAALVAVPALFYTIIFSAKISVAQVGQVVEG